MRALLIASTLAVGWVSGRCSVSGSDEMAGGLAEIMDAWSKRAHAVKQGQLRWRVSAENWNLLGRFETEWVPASGRADCTMVGTLCFNEQGARYDSTSFSFSEYAALSVQQTAEVRFQVAANGTLFQDPRYECRPLLPYTVMYLPDRGIRFWHDSRNKPPLALVLPPGSSMGLDYLGTLSERPMQVANAPADGFSAYLHHLLTAPALLAFRPFLFDDGFRDRDACQIDGSPRPVHEGRVCRVLRVTERIKVDQSSDASMPVEALYWLDSSRDFVVVRCILMWEDDLFAQIDIQYKGMEGVGWVPSKWWVLRFGKSPNTVRQVATAVIEEVDLEQSADTEEIDLRLPPGTWVVDRVTPRQYLVGDNFSEREIERDYQFPIDSYATLLPQTQQPAPASVQRQIRRVLLGLIRWPGVLIPIITISGILIITKRALTCRRMRGRSGERAEIQPDSET